MLLCDNIMLVSADREYARVNPNIGAAARAMILQPDVVRLVNPLQRIRAAVPWSARIKIAVAQTA